MSLAVVNQWMGTSGDQDGEITVTPTDGNWLICVFAWRTQDGTTPEFSVGDLARNLWTLAAQVTHPTITMGVQVWACPNVKTYGAGTRVYTAPAFIGASDCGSVPAEVFEVSGMTGGVTIDAAIPGTAAGTSITLTAPAPGGSADCLQIAAAAIDAKVSPSTSGTGWTGLTGMNDGTPAIGLAAAWREATTGGAATFTSSSHNWAGVVINLRTAGAAPDVTPDWGAVALEVQLALGYDQSTPVSAMRWKTLTTRCQSLATQRGLSAELGTPESTPDTIAWINDDGSMTPRDGGTGTATAAGTTTTIKISDASASAFVVGDFVRLETSAGALKEDTVFQITAMPSSAGTTTVNFTPAAAAATASGDVLAGVPVDIFTPVRALATVDGKTYPVLAGTAEALPQTWLDGTHGRVAMTATDAYATLTATIPNVLDAEVLRARPAEFWRLDDPSGTAQATNASERGSTAALVQKTSKHGAGTNGAAAFGTSTQDVEFLPGSKSSLFGSSASGWGQTGLASGDTNKGFALVGSSDSFPPITDGVTIAGFSCLFSSQPSGDGTVFIIRNRDPAGGGGAGSIIKLALESSSAYATVTVWDKDTHTSTRTVCSSGPCILGNSGWISWAVTITRTSWTLYTSGSTFSQSGSCDLVAEFNTIDVGGEADASWNGHCLNGVHSRLAIYDRILTAGEINQLSDAADRGLSSTAATDGAIRRQLAYAAWPGARILPRSDIITSEDNGLEGGAAGDVVAQIATWEDGLVATDAAGYLRFLPRDVLDRQTSKFTLGPDTGAGEIPYLGAPSYNADGQLLFTRIDVTNTAKIGGYLGFAADNSGTFSQIGPRAGKYGTRPRSWPTHLYRLSDVYNLGQWLVARYGVRRLRITAVQVDPRAAAGTTGWHAVLGAEFGDLITVNWKPGNAPAINTRCIIIGISHNATPSRWLTTFTLMVAPDPGIVLDDSTAGIIGSGTLTL